MPTNLFHYIQLSAIILFGLIFSGCATTDKSGEGVSVSGNESAGTTIGTSCKDADGLNIMHLHFFLTNDAHHIKNLPFHNLPPQDFLSNLNSDSFSTFTKVVKYIENAYARRDIRLVTDDRQCSTMLQSISLPRPDPAGSKISVIPKGISKPAHGYKHIYFSSGKQHGLLLKSDKLSIDGPASTHYIYLFDDDLEPVFQTSYSSGGMSKNY